MKNKNYLEKLEGLLKEVLGSTESNSIDSWLEKFGDFKTEKGTNSYGDWVKTTYTSNDGNYSQVSYVLHGKPEISSNVPELEKLKSKLQKCVDKQDFETAAILRDKIKSFEINQSKIDLLNKELDEVIKTHNFERAIEIRDELKKYNITEKNGNN